MKYYKNTELAELYHVSEKAVRNWIESASNGKLELELAVVTDRQYISNTSKNHRTIEALVEKGKKFKNTRGHKIIEPSKHFYELFNPTEIADIMLNIDVHNEIPLQYTYFDSGAVEWASYIQRLLNDPSPNTPRNIITLLKQIQPQLDIIIAERKAVNIIDIGMGDCSPIFGLLQYLLDKGVKVRYIGIDLSKEMIEIAQQNLGNRFGSKISFEAHRRDINHELFRDLTVEELYSTGDQRPLNIVLFFGGTLSNLRQPDHVLQGINNSMGRDDVLIFGQKTDSEASRRYFHDNNGGLSPHGLVLDLLNIDDSLYEVEQFYDEKKRARFIQARLKVDLSLKFHFGKGEKILELKKGQAIVVWRALHKSAIEVINQFDGNGFDILQALLTQDCSYMLTISKIKIEQL